MKSQGYSFLAPEELQGIFNSKEDLYNLLTLDFKPVNNKFSSVNYFLPSTHKCSMHYLRDVLSGKKKALKQYQIQLFPSPKYKELSVKLIWGYVKDTEELSVYFPDYGDHTLPERDYLWTIICSVKPKEAKQLIQDARAKRGVNKKENQELVKITGKMKEEIFNVVSQKTTRGNAAFMLKQSAILKKERKGAKIHKSNFEVFKKKSTSEEGSSLEGKENQNRMTYNEIQMAEEDKYNQ